jgi:type II secretory pathway pseudopilin PulG
MVTYSTDRFRHPRGSVMILVVAVLGLLAVLGTVYIVASRTQRASSAAMNADYNFNLARQGVLATVQQTIGESMLDGNGATGVTGNAAVTAARTFDYPDQGTLATGVTTYNPKLRNEPWLVAHMHYQDPSAFPAAKVPNDLTILTPNLFNPSTGAFDIPVSTTVPSTGTPSPSYFFPYDNTIGAQGLSTVVGDQTTFGAGKIDRTTDDPPTAMADAYIQLLPFSEVTGVRYRYGVRIIDTSRMANLNTGATDDAAALTDTTGKYLTSLRLAPATADMDYLNDNYFNYGTGVAGDGVLIGTVDMKTAIHQSQPTNPPSGLGRSGFSTVNATFSLNSWQQQILRIESPTDPLLSLFQPADELELRTYGEYGTSYLPRAATFNASGSFRLWPYTFANMLNAAGNFSPSGGTVGGNPRRRNYTAYSFSRTFRPYLNPVDTVNNNTNGVSGYTLTLVAGANDPSWQKAPSGYTASTATGLPPDTYEVWPSNHLQQINVNVPLSFPDIVDQATLDKNNDSMFYMAAHATNMASLMRIGVAPSPTTPQDPSVNPTTPNVYSLDETLAYAANAMTSRANGMVADTSITTTPAITAYYLPAGPSFIDDKGPCVRMATINTTTNAVTPFGRDFTSVEVKSDTVNRTYLGYAAQPFINEIAVFASADTSAGTPGTTQIADAAIELYNPYSIPLSLKGYHLVSAGGDDDLTGQFVPAQGYLIIMNSSSAHFATVGTIGSPTPTTYQVAKVAKFALDPTGASAVTLYRPYFPRGVANFTSASLAPIDRASYVPLVDPTGLPQIPPDTDPKEFSLQRFNGGTPSWGAALDKFDVRADGQTLGAVNTPVGTGYPLVDRFAANASLTQGAPYGDILEFNQIFRAAHVFDASTDPDPTKQLGVPVVLLTDKLVSLAASTAPYNNMQFPIDSQLHFNFLAAPWIYNTTPTADLASPPPGVPFKNPGDIRAVHLFEQISLTDRVSDSTIDLSKAGISGIDKLRLPGQINLNTASGDVIRALPMIQAMTTPSQNEIVANILAYRDRYATSDAKAAYPPTILGVTPTSKPPTMDFSNATFYPGKGFRSMAELLVVLGDFNATDLAGRDKDWAKMLTLCTVRSDTFIVYGYMEAVRVNPAYPASPGHNNGTDWYAGVTDDPHDATKPNLRIAQRRWVALIDRSFSNYDRSDSKFTLPRVVAIKDLPQ